MATQEVDDNVKSQGSENELFQQLEEYDWVADAEFQSGLQAILGPNPPPDQAEHLTLRARCFYLARYRNFINSG